MNRLFILLATFLTAACTTTAVSVKSPDGNLLLLLDTESGESTISITYKGKDLLGDSAVGIEFADAYFGKNVEITNVKRQKVVDDYDMPVGKSSHVHSVSNEALVTLSDAGGRIIEMYLRAFDDGVAYRYNIPAQEGMGELAIRREVLDLSTPADPVLKAMDLPRFNCSHEEYYTTKKVSELEDKRLFDMPALLVYPDGQFMAITESNVVDYAGMGITVENGALKGVLSPRLDGSGLAVTGELPRRSPWRVFQVTDRLGALIESDILTTLADPCKETDLSWLDPGIATWPWWNCYQAPAELLKGDINTVNRNFNRHYIDFCAENGIKYHSITGIIDENHNELCWYYNEGSPTGRPGDNDNTAGVYPGFDLESICKYAAEKGVKMRVWVHWKALSKNVEETFRQYEAWGIKGMMVDYMDRDDEEMIAFQKNVLELAMKYHLHIQFHGASKPSGLCRTYPCEFTRENTKNYECYKWGWEYRGNVIGSEHDLNIAFVRTLAGPADYHLGSFRAVRTEEFAPVFNRPVTTCTRAHSLALYVALQSSMHLISDAPDAYRGQTGLEFILNVPTVWDETRVLLASLDDYLVVARRKGEKWYIGGIGDSEARDLCVPLAFLGKGKFSQTLYHDAAGSDADLNLIDKTVSVVAPTDVINVHLAPNGGFAAILTPDK